MGQQAEIELGCRRRTFAFRNPCCHLLNKRQDGIAHNLRPGGEQLPVDLGHIAVIANSIRSARRNNALDLFGLG
jgi:hypothetical protein